MFDAKRKIVWFSGDGYSEVAYADEYSFESSISDEYLKFFQEHGKIYNTSANNEIYAFTSIEEYLAHWDNFEASSRGNRVHIFTCEDAISYIADDMKYCDSTQGVAEYYSEVLKKVSKLLGG